MIPFLRSVSSRFTVSFSSSSAARRFASTASAAGKIEKIQDTRAVSRWLFATAGGVFGMVGLGGLTRLTGSGLSMVEWRPVTGAVPPLCRADWEAEFEKYKKYPEFRRDNFHMELAEFQRIYFLEYVHRLWGRTLGVIFGAPLVYFAITKQLTFPLMRRLGLIFVAGGMQGAMGWYMVKSGLESVKYVPGSRATRRRRRTSVSAQRLASHLLIAFFIYGSIFWTALDLQRVRESHLYTTSQQLLAKRRVCYSAAAALGLVTLTVVAGAFVAGLKAGLIYNEFPFMGRDERGWPRFIPEDMWELNPWQLNFVENEATVQFVHRLLATCSLGGVMSVWLYGRRVLPHGSTALLALHSSAAAVSVQVILGIVTLLYGVPVGLAVLHQMGALGLCTTLLWLIHATARRKSIL